MKTLFSILLLSVAISAFTQNTSQYDNILLTTANEYRRAEPQVSLAADYVYTTPIDKDNLNRKNAISFIMKWMSGTSDYSFTMDETFMKIINSDRDLLGVFAACLTKYALQKGKGVDREDLKLNAYTLFATYCENPENNCRVKGDVKKLVDAKNQNKIKEFLETKQK
jgi:hypothetical protein